MIWMAHLIFFVINIVPRPCPLIGTRFIDLLDTSHSLCPPETFCKWTGNTSHQYANRKVIPTHQMQNGGSLVLQSQAYVSQSHEIFRRDHISSDFCREHCKRLNRFLPHGVRVRIFFSFKLQLCEGGSDSLTFTQINAQSSSLSMSVCLSLSF